MMNYFDELLESYNSIKKRTFKLKLYEAEEQHPQYQQIQAAVLQIFKAKTEKDFSSLGRPEFQLEFKPDNSVKVYGMQGDMGSGVKVIDRNTTKPKALDRLVKGLLPDEGGTIGGAATAEQEAMQQALMAKEMKKQQNLQEIVKALGKDVWGEYETLAKTKSEALFKKLEDAGLKYTSPGSLAAYFSGIENKSFPKKLAKGVAVELDDDLARVTDGLNPQLARESASTLLEAVRLVTKDSLSETDKNFFRQNFLVEDVEGKNPQVFIASNRDMTKGIVVKDTELKVLSNILSLADVQFDDFSTVKESHSNASFRGLNLEHILEPVALIATANRVGSEDLKLAALESLKKFRKDMELMAEVHAPWAMKYEKGDMALDSDDLQIVDEINSFFGGDMDMVMKGILGASKQSLKVRHPDFIVRVGEDISIGKKSDTFEVWVDPVAAKKGMAKQGYSVQDVETMPARLAFASNRKMLNAAVKSGLIESPDQEVFVNRVSLKNYMSMNRAKLGENSSARTGAVMKAMATGDYTDIPDIPVEIEALKAKLEKDLGEDLSVEAADYYKSIESIEEHVNSTVAVKQVVNDTGKTIKEDALRVLTDSLHNAVKTNSTYDEFMSRKTLAGALLAVTNEVDFTNDAEREKAKANISRYLTMSKIKSDLRKEVGNPGPATKYLLMNIGIIAGSNEDNVSGDFRDLKGGVSYNFKHDDAVNIAINGVMDGSWRLDLGSGKSIALVSSNNPKQRLILGTETKAKKVGGEHKRYQNNTVNVSKGMLDSISVKNRINENLTKDEQDFINEIMNKQYEFIRTELKRFQESNNLQG